MIYNNKPAVGIVSYGVKIPKQKILGAQIAGRQGKSEQKIYESLGVESKTVPGIDEDTITLSTASGLQALERLECLEVVKGLVAPIDGVRKNVGALFIGSESHPYAVKPTGTVVAQALGISSDSFDLENKPLALADLQFACKAGTQALQIASLYVNSGFCKYAFAIGTDTAQAKPGDVLEYTSGAGSAAFLLGSERGGEQKLLARLLATTSVSTDTPDFWRRPQQEHPQHAGRFTADPGYFTHILMAAKNIFAETGLEPRDFGYCVFHTPNAKLPMAVASKLGFTYEQIKASLLVKDIGNTYAGASMLGLASTLDIATKNKKILVVSYGSGAGSDAFVIETTEHLVTARNKWKNQNSQVSETIGNQIKKLKSVYL